MNNWMNLTFQDANSPMMEHLIFFHDTAMIILSMITILISYLIVTIMLNKNINRYLMQGHMIEMLWTIIPMIILLFMAFPSLKILYILDDLYNIIFSVKAIGHQWYWSYEFSDFKKNLEFNSFMKNYLLNDFRLLDVDTRLILPYNYNIRLLVSSTDVIHSWTIPSLGIKIDATPGRINQTLMIMNRPGLFFGQCSEICGMNHSFMPIVVESVSFEDFMNWINKII